MSGENSMSNEGSMSGEIPDELEIVLARRVSPKLVQELRLSFAEEEWRYLANTIRRAAETCDFDFDEDLKQNLSAEAIEAMFDVRDEIDIPVPGPEGL